MGCSRTQGWPSASTAWVGESCCGNGSIRRGRTVAPSSGSSAATPATSGATPSALRWTTCGAARGVPRIGARPTTGRRTLRRTSKTRDSRNGPPGGRCRPVEGTIDPHGNGWADPGEAANPKERSSGIPRLGPWGIGQAPCRYAASESTLVGIPGRRPMDYPPHTLAARLRKASLLNFHFYGRHPCPFLPRRIPAKVHEITLLLHRVAAHARKLGAVMPKLS